ncbi:outer membrane protein assembly factor BamD [Phenylobacterium sp.]|jgi:outer membrane protein assembly factor BamD|uniref:outer membrane protein assembly factor BamD n=1 Tax=Phenylobacterium sp. TaxID=1871053 RepID=UPI0025D4F1E1|nr:outer membrane protein assembly factor BamD [Phenylobacterium sp.]MCA3720292.1 outer membrane protein assembly factor BamD [Phenylobacterium sp.]
MVSVLRRSWIAPTLVGLSAAVFLSGCASQERRPRLVYEERPVELLFSTGAARLDARQWTQAVDYFAEVERQHPYSEWSRRAILMTAYANYQASRYVEAIGDAERFLSLYPGNPSAAYAYYLKAICYFDQIVDVGRDQAATGQALAALREVVQRFPKTEYAADARLKIDMVNDQLAGKEMSVGRYYLRQGDTLAAIGRFQTVIQRFQTTSHAPEALYRLVEANLTLGLMEEARRNGAVLGYNYPGDYWYREAYALLTSRNLQPAVTPDGQAKRRLPLPFIRDPSRTPPPQSSGLSPAPGEG